MACSICVYIHVVQPRQKFKFVFWREKLRACFLFLSFFILDRTSCTWKPKIRLRDQNKWMRNHKKSFYGVYFIVQWTSLWKKWWTSLWKKWSMYMWLDSSLWYLNEQEETAWLTFFWWSLSLCRVYKTEALPENEKYEGPSKTSDVWRLLMVLWKINKKILELLVYTYWYNVYF